MLILLGVMIFSLGLALGIFISKTKTTMFSSFRKELNSMFPRKRLYWKNGTEHFFTRFPEIHDFGYVLGSKYILLHFFHVLKRNGFWLNPFTPYEIKVILSRDCLGYDNNDYEKLIVYYNKRNDNILRKIICS